jgi:putative transposase
MPSQRINTANNSACYFTTFTVTRWYYLFDRYNRWDTLAQSLQYCIDNKNVKLYGFVFMINHMHLLFSSPDASGFIRDFKQFTTKELKKNISATEPHVLKLFLDKNNSYQFWQATNMPILIESEKFFQQKLQYIHYNPVRKHYVTEPEHWYWSSAHPNCMLKAVPLF